MEIDAKELILTDVAAEEVADEILASLSDLAYATPVASVKTSRPRYKSRFFFRISRTIADDVAMHKKKLAPKVMEHIDAEVEKRLKLYKKEVPPLLTSNIEVVREFFLTQIAPHSLASGAGSSQAREVVQRLLNTEIDATQFDKFERMSHAAVNIIMAKFVAKYYGLPVKSASRILAAIQPRPITLPQIPNQGKQPYEARHAETRRKGTNQTKE